MKDEISQLIGVRGILLIGVRGIFGCNILGGYRVVSLNPSHFAQTGGTLG